MPRLTNLYYLQYTNMSEYEAGFDSDNSEARPSVMDTTYYQYFEERKYLQLLHEDWKRIISTDRNLPRDIGEQCGMRVSLSECRVKYKYIPEINNELNKAFQFKITIRYSAISNKWYLSRGYSHVPPVINFRDRLIGGTRNPIGLRVLNVVREIKDLIDIHMKRLEYVENFMEYLHEAYKDIEIRVNKSYKRLKLLLSGRGWPSNIQKTCSDDSIIIFIALDEQLQVSELSYGYKHAEDAPSDLKQNCQMEFERRAHVFLDLSLEEAFKAFMDGF